MVCRGALFLLCSLYAASALRAPVQWGQNDKVINIRISKSICPLDAAVKCAVTGNREAGEGPTFIFKCGTLILKAELRDVVQAENPLRCRKSREGRICVVKKMTGYSTYAWDRLFRHSVDPPKTWPIRTTVDFSEVMDPTAMRETSYPASWQYNSKSIKAALAKDNIKAVVLDAVFPWCTMQCKDNEKYLKKAKKLLKKKDGILFGFFDAREEISLTAKAQIHCSSSCKLAIFRKDMSVASLQVYRNPKDIVKKIRKKVVRLLIPLTKASEADKLKNTGKALVLAYMRTTDKAFLTDLMTTAESVRAKVNLVKPVQFAYVASEGEPKVKAWPPTFPKSLKPMTFVPRKDGGQATMLKWVYATTAPLIGNKTEDDEFRNYLDMPVVQILDPDDTENKPAFELIAAKFRNRLTFTQRPMAHYDPDFLVPPDTEFPVFIAASQLQRYENSNSKKWAFPTRGPALLKPKSPERKALMSWLEDLASGRATPLLKSARRPKFDEWKKGTLYPVIANTVAEERLKPRDILVLVADPHTFSEPDYRDCKKEVALARVLARAFQDSPAFLVGKMDKISNELTMMGKDVITRRRSCAFVLVKGNGSTKTPIRYTGKPKQGKLLRWIKKKSKYSRKGWKGVKANLKILREALEVEKAAEQFAAEQHEALLASITPLDLTKKKDGGILIKTYKEAPEGAEKPQLGETVRAHYVGTLLDGTKFDSSRDRRDAFRFSIGQGQVIKCWDKAFATMRYGERAELTCTAKYAYGQRGSPPKIPPGATLKFDVELLKNRDPRMDFDPEFREHEFRDEL